MRCTVGALHLVRATIASAPTFSTPAGGCGCGSYFQDPVDVGKWLHVVGVVDAGSHTTAIYKNGQLRNTNAYGGTITPAHGIAPLRLGTKDFASFLRGALSQLRVWDRPLTAAEIIALYETNVVPQDGLVAEYLLNEGRGTVVHDSQGHPQGTVVGGYGTLLIVLSVQRKGKATVDADQTRVRPGHALPSHSVIWAYHQVGGTLAAQELKHERDHSGDEIFRNQGTLKLDLFVACRCNVFYGVGQTVPASPRMSTVASQVILPMVFWVNSARVPKLRATSVVPLLVRVDLLTRTEPPLSANKPA